MKIVSCFLFAAATLAAATPAPAPDVTRLYRVKCAGCHGVDGAGGAGASFKGKLAHHTVPQLEGVIKEGIPGTGMPPSGLPDPAVKKLALYVQYLNKQK